MPVRYYSSADAGAPTLSGTVGSAVALLDALLVNGYGAFAALGWAKEFTATNKAVYRAASGNRLRLRIDDTAAGFSGRTAQMRGFESMTDVDTGTNDFPTAAQVANGLAIYKSSTADATARPWTAFGDERFFYLFVQSTSISGLWYGHMFGEAITYGTGDNYCTVIQGSTQSTTTTTIDDNYFSALNTTLTTTANHYVARPYTGVAGAAAVGKLGPLLNGATMGGAGMAYPAPIDAGLYVSGIRLVEATTYRGYLPGLFAPIHARPLNHGDDVTTITGLSGVTVRVQDLATSTTALVGNQCMINITGPWR